MNFRRTPYVTFLAIHLMIDRFELNNPRHGHTLVNCA